MYFKKLLSMIVVTSLVTSGAMVTAINNISNAKLVKQSSNNHDSFSKLEGTSGTICALTSDQKGIIYAGNDQGIIYASENNENFKEIFKDQQGSAIQVMATSKHNNVYAAIKSAKNETKIYMKASNSTEFKLFQVFKLNLVSMTVFTSNGEECLYIGTDKDVQAFYPE